MTAELEAEKQVGFYQPYEIIWTKLWGDGDYESGLVAIDADDNAYLGVHQNIGSFCYYGQLYASTCSKVSKSDVVINKFDSDGELRWSTALPNSSLKINRIGDIASDLNGRIYVAGSTLNEYYLSSRGRPSDIRISRLNEDGTNIWSEFISSGFYFDIPSDMGGGDRPDIGNDIATNFDGSTITVGRTFGDLSDQKNHNSGWDYKGPDAFVRKTSAAGKEEWTRLLGTDQWDSASSVAISLDGDVIVSGKTRGRMGVGENAGQTDIFVSKLSPIGSSDWTFSFGSNGRDEASDIAIDSQGSIYITGNIGGEIAGVENSSAGAFLCRLTPEGAMDWLVPLGDFEANSIAVSDKNIYLVGTGWDYVNGEKTSGGADIYVAKYSLSGERLSSQLFGTSENDFGKSIALSSFHDSLYVSGSTYGNLNNLQNSGGADAYLIKLKDSNFTPTGLSFSTYELIENIAAGSTVAVLSDINANSSGMHSYRLVSGDGDVDNNEFTLDGNQLKIKRSPDYETRSSYSIRVQKADSDGKILEENFNFYVKNTNEAPADFSISAFNFDENIAHGSTIASLSASDPDTGDTHIYKLASYPQNPDNNAFKIEGDQLQIVDSPDFERKSAYSIKLLAEDSGGLTIEKTFNLAVNNLEEDDHINLIRDWTQLIGSSGFEYGNSTSTGNDGSIYIAGTTYGDLGGSTNSGRGQAFLSKYNSDGYKEWIRLIDSSSSYSSGSSVATDSDGSVYIAGTSDGGNAFLSKYDSDGLKEWIQHLIGEERVMNLSVNRVMNLSVNVAVDGAIYITGYTQENPYDKSYDTFLSKYKPDGSEEWTQLLGLAADERGFSVSTAVDGSVYIAGVIESPGFPSDAFLRKYKPNGSTEWTQLIGSAAADRGFSVSTGDDGSVYIVGATFGDLDGNTNSGGDDVFLSKYNSDGSKEWTQLLGSSSNDVGWSVSTALDGSVYIVGDTEGDLDGQFNSDNGDAYRKGDVFLSKFNSNGSREWTQLLGSPYRDSATSVSITSDGSVYISGHTDGDLDGQNSNGGLDAFLSKYTMYDNLLALNLSFSSINENTTAGSSVATLGISDEDATDTHTYALVSGNGDTDNSAFTIDGDQLKIVESPDFESKTSYSIRLQTKDSSGVKLARATLNVTDINEEPTDLSVSASSFDENIAGGSAVANLSSSDPDTGDTHMYALVSGDGDADNSAFAIEDDQLKILESPDFETKSSYSIRLETKDSGGLALEQEVTLNVNDINDVPIDLSASLSSFDENISDASAVATLSTVDQDSGDTHSYALVAGDGDADNRAFTIEGDQLKVIESPDFESKSSYLIRLQTKDSAGLSLEKEFTFEVNDLNEVPENFWISSSTFYTNIAGESAVATLSTVDQDAEDTHSYTLVSGFGDADNDAFTIEGDQLKIIDSPDFEEKSSYSVRLKTKDSGGLTLEKSFTLSAQELEEEDAVSGAPLTREWTQLFGTPFRDSPSAVNASADGSVYIAGNNEKLNSHGHLSYDFFLSKYNSDGSKAWTQSLETSSVVFIVWSVSTAADGSVYIAGATSLWDEEYHVYTDHAFLEKYNSDGSKEWTQLLGSPDADEALSVSTAADGSVYIAGSTKGDLDGQINSGDWDAFLSKFSSDGSKEWTQLLGSYSYEDGFSVSAAPDGSVYIAGNTDGNLDGQANNGDWDAFLSKFSSDGSKEWTRLIGTDSYDDVLSVSSAVDGSIYIAGFTEGDFVGQTNSGGTDVFLSKFNSDGSQVWTKMLGSPSNDYGYSVSAAADGSVYISGATDGDLGGQGNGGGTDAFLSKYNSDGSEEWTQLFGTSSIDEGRAVSAAVDGLVYIAGNTKGDLDGQINSGGSDAFLSKYSRNEGIPAGDSSFKINEAEIHSHGLSLQLNDTPDMNVFALYGGTNSDDKDPSVVLTNSSNEEVNLSAHWEDDTKQLHLLSNQILEGGDYTLKIRADGLVSQSGDLLDGNGDGVDGDDYEYSFTHVTPDHFISVGDTARSAGQDLSINGKHLKDGITGIPIHLSTTLSLQSVSGEISFDSDLLKDVSLAKGSDLPSDWVINYSESTPGTLAFKVSGQSVATGSIEDTLRLIGQVDAIASDSYGSTSLIQATIKDSSEGQITFKSDPGLLVNAYSGDTTGNGSHSSLDASRVQRVVVGLDSGFDAFDDINPVLIGDTTGNGSLSSLDASRIQQEVVGLPVDTFPEIPII